MLDKQMMQLQESGILKRLYFDVLRPPAPEPLPKLRDNEPLTLEQGPDSIEKKMAM